MSWLAGWPAFAGLVAGQGRAGWSGGQNPAAVAAGQALAEEVTQVQRGGAAFEPGVVAGYAAIAELEPASAPGGDLGDGPLDAGPVRAVVLAQPRPRRRGRRGAGRRAGCDPLRSAQSGCIGVTADLVIGDDDDQVDVAPVVRVSAADETTKPTAPMPGSASSCPITGRTHASRIARRRGAAGAFGTPLMAPSLALGIAPSGHRLPVLPAR